MRYAYLLALIVSLFAMVLIDKKYSLAFFHDVKRAAITVLAGVVLFIVWDVFGIVLNIFYSPGSAYVTGWYFAPNFPVEELFFLVFLCYFTLVMYLLAVRRWQRI